MRAHAAHDAAALHIVTNATIKLSRIPYRDMSHTFTWSEHSFTQYVFKGSMHGDHFTRRISLQGDTHSLTEVLRVSVIGGASGVFLLDLC